MDLPAKSLASRLRLGAALLLGLLPTTAFAATPVGIALEIDNGVGVPLQLRAGGSYYINQLDIRASVVSGVDDGVSSLAVEGDFADLSWHGIRMVDREPNLLANADGTFVRRSFYEGALWMELPSVFYVRQLNQHGKTVGKPILLNAGINDMRLASDDFFIRRMRAIQWVKDCRTPTDCTGARQIEEEALVELRNARNNPTVFNLHPHVTALQVIWSLKPWEEYVIPVQPVHAPEWDYGFQIAVDPITPPQADGTYAPGTDVTFRVTLQDGSGKPLHPEGYLPPYNEVAFANYPSGIKYYNAFSDPSTTYYRRKHRERMLMAQIIGPAQDIQPIRSILDLNDFLVPGTQVAGRPERDGVFSEVQILPEAYYVFGGAFFPELGLWDLPSTDLVTFHLPENAQPGTYIVTVKGRRVYMGEDIPATTNIEIQVGTTQRTVPHLGTGNCQNCHNNGGELTKVLHANANRAACAGCHAPLSFELEGPIVVRTHFIHSRSERFDAPLENCRTCHLSKESIQRVSKAACLSCHNSYPQWHADTFGPIESMYVGGGAESFVSCTDSCHRTHPGSRL